MSVLVKNMDMPKCCGRCPWRDVEYGRTVCRLKEDTIDVWVDEDVSRPDWCPLTEVPTKHGRLIDADAIEYTHAVARCIEDGHNWNELVVTQDEIADMPTIIEGVE